MGEEEKDASRALRAARRVAEVGRLGQDAERQAGARGLINCLFRSVFSVGTCRRLFDRRRYHLQPYFKVALWSLNTERCRLL